MEKPIEFYRWLANVEKALRDLGLPDDVFDEDENQMSRAFLAWKTGADAKGFAQSFKQKGE